MIGRGEEAMKNRARKHPDTVMLDWLMLWAENATTIPMSREGIRAAMASERKAKGERR